MEVKIHCKYDKLLDAKKAKALFHDKNRNTHPPEQIDRLVKIIQYQGFRYPVKISNQSKKITSGHGRVLAAERIKCKVPVVYQDYEDEAQEYADIQADNAIALWAELDLSGINSDIGDFGPHFDLDLLGIKNFTVDVADKYADQDLDAIPGHVEPKAKLGDIYQLGSHRLMCGDSTSIDAVEKLMDGEKADLLWTDPPYGVSYTEKNEYLNRIGKPMACPNPIENDSRSPEEMNELWFTVLSNAHTVMTNKSSYYIASPQGGDLMMMMMSIRRAGFQLKHSLVWVKNNHVLGRCDYHYKHEPLLYGWKENGTHEFYGNGRCKTSVWDFDKPLKNDLHPTMKPIELIEEALLNSSDNKGKILDLFGGSGSTLIACEKTSRTCFMMELDPHYCDVICARWEKMTGQKAELINGGR